jgi:UDP-N-acetylmuramoyl-L-alanyl-D-glutamate--2,6-diaminopimelate ligase
MVMVGVTGTDGKTTTANLIHSILTHSGHRAGLISTVNAFIGGEALDTGLHTTTPDAPQVQALLAQMARAGLTRCILEATSHGLAQERVTACEFDVAVVTNITHEHLDYHGTAEAYRAAKGRLFAGLATAARKPGQEKVAVLNRDDSSFDYLQSLATGRQVSYSQVDAAGLAESADVVASDVKSTPDGTRFTVTHRGQPFQVETSLFGRFNVSNCLAAAAVALEGLSVSAEAVQTGIAGAPPVPGRMERIDMGQAFTAVVDFAHTPNALARALETAREMTSGRVIAVFGSAGLRDRAKRRLMPAVSAALADLTVLTAEDPRTEPLDGILAEMADACARAGGVEGRTFWRVPDRGDALRHAVGLARPGDLVIACGKGHEQSMCFGEFEHPWDDRTALRAALAELLGRPGPPMPWLPTSRG